MARLSYLSKDFSRSREEAIQKIPTITDRWTDFNESDPGIAIVELLSGFMEVLQFYMDNQTPENFLLLARQRKNVKNLTKALAYVVKPPFSSTGEVLITLDAQTGGLPKTFSKYTIPVSTAGTEVATPFIVSEDVTFTAVSQTKTVDVIQGVVVEDTLATSDGSVNQKYQLPETEPPLTKAIAYNGVIIDVGGVEWERKNTLVFSSATALHYVIELDEEDRFFAVFGDSQFGAVPPNLDTITAKYLKTDGVNGNVGALTLTSIISPSGYSFSSTNASGTAGGANQETIESAKALAPALLASLERAVTRKDYLAWLLGYPGVAKSNAWGENEELPPNYDLFNRVQYTLVPTSTVDSDGNYLISPGGEPAIMGTLASDVLTNDPASLNDRKVIAIKLEHVQFRLVEYDIGVTIYVDNRYGLSDVESDVTAAITSLFSFDNQSLGKDVQPGEIYRAIVDVAGVNNASIDLLQRITASIPTDSGLDFTTTVVTKEVHKWEVPKIGTLAVTTLEWADRPSPDVYSELV